MLNFIPQFSDAIQAAGMIPPNAIEADGELYRFSSNGKKGDDAGWYVLHGDGIPAGKFGNWRTSFAQNWRADIGRTLTPAEEAESRAKIAAAQAKREAEEIKRKANAKAKALSIWEKAEPAPGDHPYLARKGIKANGAKLHSDGRLVIPMRADGEIHSLQFIGSDGVKRFLTDGRGKGLLLQHGEPERRGGIVYCRRLCNRGNDL
jgi:putative DNA primase/helicase